MESMLSTPVSDPSVDILHIIVRLLLQSLCIEIYVQLLVDIRVEIDIADWDSMPPFARGQVRDLGPLSSPVRHAKKESILTTLNKLCERDTQQTAVDEIRRLITVIQLFWPDR